MSSERPWRPSAPLDNLRSRARILAGIRAFFAQHDVLEVETPVLSAAAVTDPALESFSTHFVGPGQAEGLELYLHTSPEFAMKRLLAAGSGAIYQLCKVFRQGEAGRRHNPEFTLLEWYRPGFDHRRLMGEVEALVRGLLSEYRSLAETEYLSYGEAFERYLGIDPYRASAAELAACAKRHGVPLPPHLEAKDGWLDLLLVERVEPQLGRGRLTFLYDYPPSQAALARIRAGEPAVAERFELYCEGLELANGFHELGDSDEQRRRFEQELAERQAVGLSLVPLDEALLEALQHGLPDCAGVALGVDRLVMLAADAGGIDEVIGFPVDRA